MSDASAPLSVSRLVDLLQETIEDNFMQVLVEGEISNLARPASGHLYLTLKDSGAQLRAVMFRTAARLLRFRPEDGQQVVCRGRVTVYRQRGDLQLIIDSLDAVGAGSLQLAFEQLKQRLAAEGLFAEKRKRSLPTLPRRVGIVTSATGAALHDMLQVFRRQGVGLQLLLRPVRVQGEQAPGEIADAIADLNALADVDVMIIGRGGGSLEDLWAFNDEMVARAIVASRIPVISAVGHEVDYSIADFVADLRAATPTAAAERIVRGRLELEAHLDRLRLRLGAAAAGRVTLLRERLAGVRRRLVSPAMQLQLRRERLQAARQRLLRAGAAQQQACRQRIALLAGRLDALSPLQTLKRGYVIVRRAADGSPVTTAATLEHNEWLDLQFASGMARVRVEEVEA